MLSVDVGSIVRFLFNVCRQPPSESRAGGGSQPTGVRGAGFQMQSQSRRGFVPEAELWPNPNPGFPGRSRGLQGTARRALPPASAAGLGCPADGPSPWQGHGSTEFVAGGTRGDALWCPLWLRGGARPTFPSCSCPLPSLHGLSQPRRRVLVSQVTKCPLRPSLVGSQPPASHGGLVGSGSCPARPDGAPGKPASPVGKAPASLGTEDFLSYGLFFPP